MPSNKVANVKFEYFQAFCADDNAGANTLFDIHGWLIDMDNLSHGDRVRQIGEMRGRLEEIRLTHPHNFHAMNFMRMDAVSDAYVVRDNEPAEHIDLSTDEYLGRSTAVIYDSNYHILMIQKNRGGHSVHAIQSYINATSRHGLCNLRPISEPITTGLLHRKQVKKLEVRFSNVSVCRGTRSESFERAISAMNSMEAVTGAIEISVGYSRTKSLNQDMISNFARDVYDNLDGVSSAKVTLAEDHQTAVFDLLDNLSRDTIRFSVPAHGSLGFEQRINDMDEKYFSSRNRLLSNLVGR